jgi:excinuclease UvrABC nuclease subunit
MMNLQEYAITELTRSMKLAAEREEYQSAADMKRIKEGIENVRNKQRLFTEDEIEQLQNKIHKIVGNGEVMQEFNKLLCNNAG